MPVYPGSRYAHAARRLHDGPAGATPYLDLRIIRTPPPRDHHIVQDGERTDLVASRHFADPERYWRICDAQLVFWPEDLVARPGRAIRIPGPEG
ncbi:MAG: hypothetical protein QOD77_276 [Thermoplasmata archaeon]|jgi:hypothetical protein|nr:hypothetical protein [Thermoplasmata archaeon]